MPEPTGVQLFITCIIDALFPQAGEAVLEVLEAQGAPVAFPPGQTCCGQPAYNGGFREEARGLALRFMDTFEAAPGPVVCPSGSCTVMIRHGYPDLFAGDPAQLARANALAARTYEFSQYLVDVLGLTELGAHANWSIAYQPSCHLLRGLGLREQAQALLAGVKGATLAALPEAEECCGFGGLFAVRHGDISGEILRRKLEAIQKSGAQVVAGCDMGCLMHIQGGLRRAGENVRCVHLAEVLANKV